MRYNKIVEDTKSAIELVTDFNNALNAGDVDAMMALCTPDIIFENTHPPPDGTRYAGQDAVRAFWLDFFRGSRRARIETERIIAANDHCVMLWTYHWEDWQGKSGHIRGVDVYFIRGGLIAIKLSYVKG
jgi:ketosteroid isomerase-like protein